MGDARDFYEAKFVANSDERLELFRGLVEHYAVTTALYPGSAGHVTPSFVLPTVVHVDLDKRAQAFFSDPEVLELVRERREYAEEPTIRFHLADPATRLPEPDGSFDLLISQGAPDISEAFKRFLKVGGYLVADNSRGEADRAALDPDYALMAVYKRHGEVITFVLDALETYMFLDRETPPTPDQIARMVSGAGYARVASGAVFQRVR
jgi:hypothetical protein